MLLGVAIDFYSNFSLLFSALFSIILAGFLDIYLTKLPEIYTMTWLFAVKLELGSTMQRESPVLVNVLVQKRVSCARDGKIDSRQIVSQIRPGRTPGNLNSRGIQFKNLIQ